MSILHCCFYVCFPPNTIAKSLEELWIILYKPFQCPSQILMARIFFQQCSQKLPVTIPQSQAPHPHPSISPQTASPSSKASNTHPLTPSPFLALFTPVQEHTSSNRSQDGTDISRRPFIVEPSFSTSLPISRILNSCVFCTLR